MFHDVFHSLSLFFFFFFFSFFFFSGWFTFHNHFFYRTLRNNTRTDAPYACRIVFVEIVDAGIIFIFLESVSAVVRCYLLAHE